MYYEWLYYILYIMHDINVYIYENNINNDFYSISNEHSSWEISQNWLDLLSSTAVVKSKDWTISNVPQLRCTRLKLEADLEIRWRPPEAG